MIHQWAQVPKRKSVIVQRYLANPLLVNGSKFDLRVYAYVTSFDPLQIYVCRSVGVPWGRAWAGMARRF